MGRIYAIANQKGGVAKTTTAVNLGAYLAELGKKVLLIDIDPQGNASSGLDVDRANLEYCIYDVLVNEVIINKVIQPTSVDDLYILPATLQLAGAEVELANAISREIILKSSIKSIVGSYDYILIDCPPSLGLLTLNALTAADGVIIPIQCEYYALEGLGQLISTIDLIKRHLNSQLTVRGIVLTMFDGRTNLSIQVADEVKKFFPEKVFKTIIPRNVRLSEAPSHGKPISTYDSGSRGAQAYGELAKEVIEGD